MPSTYRIGEVVRAARHITDTDSKGRPYIHSLKGGHGIIIAIVYDEAGYSEEEIPTDTPNGYTVAWEPEGHGVMDVNPEDLEPADKES